MLLRAVIKAFIAAYVGGVVGEVAPVPFAAEAGPSFLSERIAVADFPKHKEAHPVFAMLSNKGVNRWAIEWGNPVLARPFFILRHNGIIWPDAGSPGILRSGGSSGQGEAQRKGPDKGGGSAVVSKIYAIHGFDPAALVPLFYRPVEPNVGAFGVHTLAQRLDDEEKSEDSKEKLDDGRPSAPFRPSPRTLLRIQIATFVGSILFGALLLVEGFKRIGNAVDGGRQYVLGWAGVFFGACGFCYGIVQIIDRYP